MVGRSDNTGKLKMFSGQVGTCKSLNWEGCKVKGIASTSYSCELPESNCIALHHLAGIWSSEMKAKYFTCRPFNYHLYKKTIRQANLVFLQLTFFSGVTPDWYQKKHSPTHLSWSLSNLYQLLPSTTTHSIIPVQFTCLTIYRLKEPIHQNWN